MILFFLFYFFTVSHAAIVRNKSAYVSFIHGPELMKESLPFYIRVINEGRYTLYRPETAVVITFAL